ncbi:MAG: MFS transporter [Rhodoblastus sp.]|nr:MAG: MFS transporter [Rhodoblastus sp.]
MPLLWVLGLAAFSGALAIRASDPVVPLIARDFSVSLTAAALISSAYSLPYALGQPILGPIGDAVGKTTVMRACVAVAAAAMGAAALAPSYETLFAARMVAGVAGGGVIPVALAIIGDRFQMEDRQVALARVLFAAVTGQLVGSVGSGLIGERFGWRGSFLVAFAISVVAAVTAFVALRPRPDAVRQRATVAGAMAGYRQVFANPLAAVCYSTVFVEGVIIYGVFPHLAGIFEGRGVGGVREAGFTVGAFGFGGILMTMAVRMMLRHLGMFPMMRLGGLICGAAFSVAALVPAWQATTAAFVALGFGFYMIHNSLQTLATELAPTARGSAVSLHAFFFFVGIALGPPVIGLGLHTLGDVATILLEAAGAAALGVVATFFLTARGAARR